MAQLAIEEYLKMIPAVKFAPSQYLWSSYDAEADVMYINFKKPSKATDSELTDDVIPFIPNYNIIICKLSPLLFYFSFE